VLQLAEKITAKQLLNQAMAKHFWDANVAKQNGELVGWATSIFPQEFCETMGLTVVYPENHAAVIAARKGATPLLEQAESAGYNVDLCSYARLNLAYMKSQAAEIPIPLPDFVLCCNNICNTLLGWYQNLAVELDVPLILIDVLFNHGYDPSPAAIEYVKAEFEECIHQLEEITGKPFDYERFQTVMEISNENSVLWKQALYLNQAVPGPLNGFETFNYMGMMVCMRGKKETGEILKVLIQEMEEMIARGECCYPDGEKYRIMWDGIACWPYLGHNFKFLRANGINIVCSSYPDAWVLCYQPGNLDDLARVYTMVGNNTCMEYQADRRSAVVKEFNVEGVLFHVNRSCKVMDFMQYEQQRLVGARTGVPIITFDGDQSDPRNFAPAQFETRIEALMEMMDQAKARKSE
jgi:benzoyl-CoA reductase/2-hydroxyglutaryl-CoA dehydratase subunit BcrC/BadD/HgdB